MKSKVKFSTYCSIITVVVIIALIVGIVTVKDNAERILLSVIIVCVIGVGLFYCPVSIEVDTDKFIIHRLLKDKHIPYNQISAVDRCFPSAGGLRMCGSGGFMGYWGYFHDIIIGSYFGYYGDRSQCVLVRLKSGAQYVVSCEEPDRLLEACNEHLV
ncbi:MAG: PH domain-containing protein [Muribaculaceae bacterium]|nr:PH domain-containing protein [Muribaculaceae bacterium]